MLAEFGDFMERRLVRGISANNRPKGQRNTLLEGLDVQ